MKISQSSIGLLFSIASLIATPASGQDAYFRELEIPPKTAGTCVSTLNRVTNKGALVGGHLTIKSVVPGRTRDISVLVDSLHRTLGYSEFETSTDVQIGSSVGDIYVASFKHPERVTGFAMHSTTKVPVPDFKHFDSTSVRKIGETSRTVSTRRPLTPDEQRRAREIAEWLRKRCPTDQ